MKWQDTKAVNQNQADVKWNVLIKKHFPIGRTPKTYRIGVKLLFGLLFKLDLWLAISSFLRETFASSPKTFRLVFENGLAKIYFEQKFIYERWCKSFSAGFVKVLPLRKFLRQKTSEMWPLKNVFGKSCQGKRCANFSKFCRQKS